MTDFTAAENFILEKMQRELPANLSYHGIHHTRDVLHAAIAIAASEHISHDEIKLLRIAILFHDAGFIFLYKGHEEKGGGLVREFLPQFGFDEKQIEIICAMILSTKIPQNPHTQLERIICDADLDYLGRDDFFPIGNTLFEELKIYAGITDEKQWNLIQLNFLKQHYYHTDFGKNNREAKKQEHLAKIERMVTVD